MIDKMRRRILTTGAVGVAGFASAIASGKAFANTQNPPEPKTKTFDAIWNRKPCDIYNIASICKSIFSKPTNH